MDFAHARSAAVDAVAVGCAELASEYEWSRSELGPRGQWRPAVEAVVQALLEATVPMAYCHGGGHAMVYNDRFADILGPKHPSAWGQRAALILPEIWPRPRVAEVLDAVFAGGQPFHDDGDITGLDSRQHRGRDGAHLVGSYSAVRDNDGSILGVLVIAVETTSAVRRIQAVIDLVTALAAAVTVDDVAMTALQHAISTLGCETASVCLHRDDQGGWRVASRRETELWDDAAARQPLTWSIFPAGARTRAMTVAETGRRFVSESGGEVVLPIGGPEVAGSIGYLGMQRHLSDAQLVVLETSALLVASAMVRAMHLEARRGAAELLQRTLMPRSLPSVQGVTLAGRYEPVTTGTAAGGDFYDSFTLPDGRLAFTVGDVMGRGAAAVTVMGQVRAGLRGAALANPDSDAIFAALDELVRSLDVSWPAVAVDGQSSPYAGAAGFSGELFVTALIGVLDPATGELLLASAGHVQPAVVLRRKEQGGTGEQARVAELAAVEPGPPLGIPGKRPVLRLVLDEGDALVAYTDGLLEPHKRTLAEGLGALLRILSTMTPTEPRAICAHLVDELIGPDGQEDDCAILVLLRDSTVRHMASVMVPPHAGAVRGARHWVRDQLEAWGLDEAITDAAVMGVSELVTNVVLHAGTPAIVSLELARRLLVTVEDTGEQGGPDRHTSEGIGAMRGRGLSLVEATSDSMGHQRGVNGLTVWFEIELDRPRR